MHIPPEGTPEGKLLEVLRNPRDWVDYSGEGDEKEDL